MAMNQVQNRYESSRKERLDKYIKKEDFRIVDLYKKPKKMSDEIFVTIETTTNKELGQYKRTYGYAKKGKAIEEVFASLIRERPENDHITLIDWGDKYLMVFEDGCYISRTTCFVTKEAIDKLTGA